MNISDAQTSKQTLRVWDLIVRIFHWSLVLSFGTAWFSSDSRGEFHQWIGLGAAALILVRLVWGFIGTPYAKFTQFVRTPMNVARYVSDIIKGKEARYIGHNPAGGFMVLALLLGVAATALTGWLMTTDAYYGDDAMQTLHSLSANAMVLLIVVHVSGVIHASYRHKENLVASMINGNKREPQIDDVI
jgi:cytochrome b